MFRKLKNQKGSAMSLAIVLIVLVSIVGSSITMMVNNQMKLYQVNASHTNLKYDTEEGIEKVIGKFIEDIDVQGKNEQFSEIGILQSYVELAEIIVASNGKFNSAVNAVLNKIKQGIVTEQDIALLIDELGSLRTMVGKSNPDAKELIGIAEEYANFFLTNFFNNGSLNVSNVDIKVAKGFVEHIINSLSTRKFDTKNGAYYGNVGVIYRDIFVLSGKGQPFINIHTQFNNSNPANVAGRLNQLKDKTELTDINTWAENNIDNILDDIEGTNYIENIRLEIYNIKKGSYLDEKKIKHYYSTTGNVNYMDTVSKRLEIVKKEIDMLVQWLNIMKGKANGGTNGGGNTVVSNLEVSIPKQVTIDNKAHTISITPVIDTTDISMTDDASLNRYVFNVLSPSAKTNILAKLKIESQTDDYTIESDVDVNIYGIVSNVDYKVEYEVINWNKKID